MNVKHSPSLSSHEPFLDVIVTRKINVDDYSGIRLQQAITHLVYSFDLSEAVDVETIPGITLKLHPVNKRKMSTFATFLPDEGSGYFTNNDRNMLKVFDGERDLLLWEGAEDQVDGNVVLLIDSLPDGAKKVRVHAWFEPARELLEEAVLYIPYGDGNVVDMPVNTHGCHKSVPKESDQSLRQVGLHYYRGTITYTKLNEISEFIRAALVGFLSPFVLLGIVFAAIAVCLCLWLNYSFARDERIIEDDGIVEEHVFEKGQIV